MRMGELVILERVEREREREREILRDRGSLAPVLLGWAGVGVEAGLGLGGAIGVVCS